MVVSPWLGANGGGSYTSTDGSVRDVAVVGATVRSVDSSDDESGNLVAESPCGAAVEKHSDIWTLYSLPLSWFWGVNFRIMSHSPSCDTTR
jgi:hypothetical protein